MKRDPNKQQHNKNMLTHDRQIKPGLFVCLFAWGLMALSAQIGYIMP